MLVSLCGVLGCVCACTDAAQSSDAPAAEAVAAAGHVSAAGGAEAPDAPRAAEAGSVATGGAAAMPSDAGSTARDAAAEPVAAADLPQICSGCADAAVVAGDNQAHFHHVHINSADVAESKAFYERVFGSFEVRLNGLADVEKADGAFLLIEPVGAQPSDVLDHGIEHIGWGSMDVDTWYAQAVERDIRVDQRTKTFDGPSELYPGFFFIYLQGPSNERIEIYTEMHDEFGHVHLMTDDVDTTIAWYEDLLGVQASAPQASTVMLINDGMPVAWSSNSILIDKVNMIFFGPPFSDIPAVYSPTDDAPVGHIAFCFADLDPIVARVGSLGLEVVSADAVDAHYGFRSLLVRAPNRVLIELVEAPAVPNPFSPDA